MEASCFELDLNVNAGFISFTGNTPIGKPLSNVRLYITDAKQRLLPVGVAGELCIGGAGVGRGYLNRPELTAEKFVPNPFAAGEMMYRTGDLARWMPDGNVEFFGRIDHQVKIRGFRIELGEIESQLLKLAMVKEAVVLANVNEQGEAELCAYVVTEEEMTVSQLRGALSQTLPSFMVPAYFVQLEKLPLTPNGKLDRKALPVPEGGLTSGVDYVAPRNETEAALASLWQDLLGVAQVGIHDNFFELGGHSLKAMTLLSRLQRELSVSLSLGDVFRHPTLEGMAEAAASREKTAYAAIQPVAEQEYYPVSSTQKRMYVLSELEGAGLSYNMPVVLQLEGEVDRGRLEQAMTKLTRRHEALRTSFEMREGEVVQIVHPQVDLTLSVKEATEGEAKAHVEAFIRPFDLSLAPLLRAELIQLAPQWHLLLFDMHHIISDGVSMSVLVEEFTKLYTGETLPELRIQYKDYAVWQLERVKSEAMQKQETYWLETFSGELPTLQLPMDYPRPAIRSFEGSRSPFTLDETLTGKLRGLAEETGTTLYMVLLSAYAVLLSKYSRQTDIVIGSPIAGRQHADVERMMGVFVNTLAMRIHPSGEKTFASFLKEVKGQALAAYEHQEYPFEELVEMLHLNRDISRNPLFDTMFVLQNTGHQIMDLPALRITPYEMEHRVAKFDLTLIAEEVQDQILCNLEYSTSLFNSSTAEEIINNFKLIIEHVVGNKGTAIMEIPWQRNVEEAKQAIDTDISFSFI